MRLRGVGARALDRKNNQRGENINKNRKCRQPSRHVRRWGGVNVRLSSAGYTPVPCFSMKATCPRRVCRMRSVALVDDRNSWTERVQPSQAK